MAGNASNRSAVRTEARLPIVLHTVERDARANRRAGARLRRDGQIAANHVETFRHGDQTGALAGKSHSRVEPGSAIAHLEFGSLLECAQRPFEVPRAGV